MRLGNSFRRERVGAVRVYELQRVIELDSGTVPGTGVPGQASGSRVVSSDAIRSIESEMVIVVPCMNETRSVIEGVLSGIPHDCLIVLVSNSDRRPVDRFEIEAQTVEQFCRLAGRWAVFASHKDPGPAVACAVVGVGYMMC